MTITTMKAHELEQAFSAAEHLNLDRLGRVLPILKAFRDAVTDGSVHIVTGEGTFTYGDHEDVTVFGQ